MIESAIRACNTTVSVLSLVLQVGCTKYILLESLALAHQFAQRLMQRSGYTSRRIRYEELCSDIDFGSLHYISFLRVKKLFGC